MKNLFTIIFLLLGLSLSAQQEPHYTNFMYNQQLFNPSYVGSRNTPSFTALHRSQWIGFEGAPYSEVLSFHSPIMRNRAGVGGTISRYAIGVSYAWYGSVAYSYNLKLTQDLNVRLGMQGTLEDLGINFADQKVVTVSQFDPSLNEKRFEEKYVGNVGVGAYITYKNLFYLGLSAPQLYPNDVGLNDNVRITSIQSPHRYANLGAVIPVSEQLDLMPNFMMKWVDHAPIDFDINFSIRYLQKITVGVTARTGGDSAIESMDGLLFFQVSPKFGVGLGYDYTLSKIKNYQSGSVEVLLRYDLRDEKGDLENPRYFKKK
ncbi:MAG: type IX secretion system membrane protein PorP/SprF [Saprospiraceae bacterium]|nr:type IX secretion system membrane protein PorP/SprF [Saprospiraceae bacterium]MCF8250747.1 type IX secretion system membrane protein PorP/SprF [Saprospiraceae bacterium]MCF8279804.1 type IX secretion system membrane protein PorP/SprF [Bacteroidales bacterium]MCF8310491.1 type IX secretion system membrane protein PorP/SprF [Saprospiraceae bacterium]MCF8440877.1 type IX secretion system membrane protein PorP/SprF [Saprospiraceae bacterium]